MEARSPRSGSQQIQCLVRTLFQVYRWHLLAMTSHGGKGKGALWSLFYKDTNPIVKAPTPSCPNHLPKPHLLTASLWNSGGTPPFSRRLWNVHFIIVHSDGLEVAPSISGPGRTHICHRCSQPLGPKKQKTALVPKVTQGTSSCSPFATSSCNLGWEGQSVGGGIQHQPCLPQSSPLKSWFLCARKMCKYTNQTDKGSQSKLMTLQRFLKILEKLLKHRTFLQVGMLVGHPAALQKHVKDEDMETSKSEAQ